MNKFTTVVIVAIGLAALYYYYNSSNNNLNASSAGTGTIIILNGPSSVGKSTIQKKVQELFKQPYLRRVWMILRFYLQVISQLTGLFHLQIKEFILKQPSVTDIKLFPFITGKQGKK